MHNCKKNTVATATEICPSYKFSNLLLPSFQLLVNAKVCINMIAAKLGENNWLLNGEPSEVDCTLYAYLSVLLHIGVTNNDLKSHINECPNLLAYIKRIRTKYLTDVKVPEKVHSSFDGVKRLFISEEDGALSRTSLKIIAGVTAVGAMVIFAITHGILEVRFNFSLKSEIFGYHVDRSFQLAT